MYFSHYNVYITILCIVSMPVLQPQLLQNPSEDKVKHFNSITTESNSKTSLESKRALVTALLAIISQQPSPWWFLTQITIATGQYRVVPVLNEPPPNLFGCGCVEQQDQAALLGVNPQELQQDAVDAQPLRRHQQPVGLEQTQKHLGFEVQQRARHLGNPFKALKGDREAAAASQLLNVLKRHTSGDNKSATRDFLWVWGSTSTPPSCDSKDYNIFWFF